MASRLNALPVTMLEMTKHQRSWRSTSTLIVSAQIYAIRYDIKFKVLYPIMDLFWQPISIQFFMTALLNFQLIYHFLETLIMIKPLMNLFVWLELFPQLNQSDLSNQPPKSRPLRNPIILFCCPQMSFISSNHEEIKLTLLNFADDTNFYGLIKHPTKLGYFAIIIRQILNASLATFLDCSR